jgi:hypothetical protein
LINTTLQHRHHPRLRPRGLILTASSTTVPITTSIAITAAITGASPLRLLATARPPAVSAPRADTTT